VYIRGVSRTSKAILIVAFILTTTQQSSLNESYPYLSFNTSAVAISPNLFSVFSPRRDPLSDVTHYSPRSFIQLVLSSGPRLTTYFPIKSQISERSHLINASTRPPEITALSLPNCLSITGARTAALTPSNANRGRLTARIFPPFPPPRYRLLKGCMDKTDVCQFYKVVVATHYHPRHQGAQTGGSSYD